VQHVLVQFAWCGLPCLSVLEQPGAVQWAIIDAELTHAVRAFLTKAWHFKGSWDNRKQCTIALGCQLLPAADAKGGCLQLLQRVAACSFCTGLPPYCTAVQLRGGTYKSLTGAGFCKHAPTAGPCSVFKQASQATQAIRCLVPQGHCPFF